MCEEKSLLWIIEEAQRGQRLDQALALRFAPLSRTYFEKSIASGAVRVNRALQPKRYLLELGDRLEICFPPEDPIDLIGEDLPLDILFEDDSLLVLNKAVAMVVHPGPGHFQGTVAHALAYRGVKDPDHPHRPGIVHRLDKDTSGVMVTAKNSQVHRLLVEAFSQREVKKTYLAIACEKALCERIEAPIGRDPFHRQRMAVHPKGRSAITEVETIQQSLGPWSLSGLKIDLGTGRTHQIRVHLRFRGAPILGDSLYGWPTWNEHYDAPRQMLHAWRLAFAHPVTGKPLRFEAALPKDMAELWRLHLGLFPLA